MAVKKLLERYYEGESSDDKPTGVIAGSTFRETDTQKLWITYDGTNWIVADKRVRLVDESGDFVDLAAVLQAATEMAIDTGEATGGSNTTLVDTGKSWETNMWADSTFEVVIAGKSYLGVVISNTATTLTFAALAASAAVVAGCAYGLKRPVTVATLAAGSAVIGKLQLVDSAAAEILGALTESPATYSLGDRLKAIVTALAALGYEFTINGVNFNGYANIKMLTLDANAEDDDPHTLHDAGVDYQVGVGKVFIAFQALIWLEQIALVGRIGESDEADGAITKEVLKFSKGVQVPFMESCIGVFAAGKYVTAETDSNSDNYTIKSGSVLYGVEVDA